MATEHPQIDSQLQGMAASRQRRVLPLEKRLFTIPEAGRYLGRTEGAVRELIWKGLLPSVKIGRRVHVDIVDMDRLIERNKVTEGDI